MTTWTVQIHYKLHTESPCFPPRGKIGQLSKKKRTLCWSVNRPKTKTYLWTDLVDFFLARGTTKKPNFDIVQPNIPEIQKSCFWFTGCPICKRAASSKLVEDLALDLPVSFHYHYRHYGLWQQQYFSELPPGGHVQAEVRGYNNNVLIIIIVFWSLHSCLTIFLSAFLPVQYCSSVT